MIFLCIENQLLKFLKFNLAMLQFKTLFTTYLLATGLPLLSTGGGIVQDQNNSLPVIYSPFQIHIDPMESLLLVNIENDPDTLYIGFEPQLFDDTINGTGMLVIAWRIDGYVDVYHQPTLNLDHAKYDIAGKGLANMVEREMNGSYFRITERGVDSWFSFRDIHNREVEVKIVESNSRKRKPFGLLAPMGSAAENPSSMPMILLHDFYFVRQNHTEYYIKVNGKEHFSDKLPVKMDRNRMYFIRYCPDPLIATINPAYNGSLKAIPVSLEIKGETKSNKLQTVYKDGRYLIETISSDHKNHTVQMSFNPPFPNIIDIKANEVIHGKFSIEGDRSTGRIRGVYSLKEKDGEIHITMNPSKGWKPRPDKFSLRMMYTVAGIFKNWPKTYTWNARISFDNDKKPAMQSGWQRN
jgi:hypothetical protein